MREVISRLERERAKLADDLEAVDAALAVLKRRYHETKPEPKPAKSAAKAAGKAAGKSARKRTAKVCPECGKVCANAQGWGIHRRAAHGIAGSSPAAVRVRSTDNGHRDTLAAIGEARKWTGPGMVDGDLVTTSDARP